MPGQSSDTPRFSLLTLLVVLTACCLLLGLVGVRIKRAQQESTRGNNLKSIALAFLIYHDKYGSFPPAYVTDEKGQPMHSWRVLLLEVMDDEQSQQLFQRYDFDKPWNSPANKALAAEIPAIYTNPFAFDERQETSYMVITGPGTFCLMGKRESLFAK